MAQPLIPIEDIHAARRRVEGRIQRTPLDLNATFSTLCGRKIHLKLENLQKTGSFKVRGAINKIQQLGDSARRRGVVTASAGNHAQGVAYAAATAKVPVTVYMPAFASFSKVSATRAYGAEVVLEGNDYNEAYARAAAFAAERGAAFVHAFDDADVIAGQGTLGLEVLEQLPGVDTIVVPVGGGGLLSGVLSAVRGMGSAVRVVAVQAAGASALVPSLRDGARVELETVDTIADGLAARAIGRLPFEIIRDNVDLAVEVVDAEIAHAVLLLLERAKTVVEGAGAVALAACLTGRLPPAAESVAVIISGGNIDMNLLDRIINLGLVQQGRLARFSTQLPDRPGALQRLVTCVAACRANIHQIIHERSRPGLPLTRAAVTLELETRGPEHVVEIQRALQAEGFVLENGA